MTTARHTGHHAHAASRNDRSRLLATLSLAVAVLVLEIVRGLQAHSMALLSDAAHMLTDVSSQGLALLALVVAARPADARRTYGYYRLEILAALVNGVALIVIALFIVYHAWERLRTPVAVHAGIVLVTAAIALVINGFGAWLLRHSHSLNVKGAYLHLLGDLFASLAIIAGAIVMSVRPDALFVDPAVSVLIAGVIVWSAVLLVRDAVDVLLEAVPAGLDLARVSGDIARVDGVREVHDLHIWTITSGMYALSAHLVVDERARAGACDDLLTAVKEVLLREHHITHSTLQVESAVYEHFEHVHD